MDKKGELWILEYFYLFGRLFLFALVMVFIFFLLSDFMVREVNTQDQQADILLARALHNDCFGEGLNSISLNKFNQERLNRCMTTSNEKMGARFSLSDLDLNLNKDIVTVWGPTCYGERNSVDCYVRELPVRVNGEEAVLKMEVIFL